MCSSRVVYWSACSLFDLTMEEYLIGICYHEPEPWRLFQQGVIEDYESSTGIFITAPSEADAISWGEHIAEALHRFVNGKAPPASAPTDEGPGRATRTSEHRRRRGRGWVSKLARVDLRNPRPALARRLLSPPGHAPQRVVQDARRAPSPGTHPEARGGPRRVRCARTVHVNVKSYR